MTSLLARSWVPLAVLALATAAGAGLGLAQAPTAAAGSASAPTVEAESTTTTLPTTTAPITGPCRPSSSSGIVATPDVVGTTVTDAQRLVGHSGLVVAAETTSGIVAPGTVVTQSPPAGTLAFLDPTAGARCGVTQPAGVSVTIAVPPTTPCTAVQLAATFQAGGPGAGNDFGTVVLRDISSSWCTLSGPIGVVGFDAGHGDQVSNVSVTQVLSVPVPRPLVLSPEAPPPVDGTAPSPLVTEADVLVSAEYRDTPTGLCTSLQQVIPAAWRLTLPGAAVLTVANHDPDAPVPGFGSLITCQGELNTPTPVQLSG